MQRKSLITINVMNQVQSAFVIIAYTLKVRFDPHPALAKWSLLGLYETFGMEVEFSFS